MGHADEPGLHAPRQRGHRVGVVSVRSMLVGIAAEVRAPLLGNHYEIFHDCDTLTHRVSRLARSTQADAFTQRDVAQGLRGKPPTRCACCSKEMRCPH